MLLVHQAGKLKVGEVVRYTLTYTPSHDRILPSPPYLHVKIKNTSAVPLRAAYLHGPYTLYTACYPSTFDPNSKHEDPKQDGVPQFESNLKAGGSWSAKLKIPDKIKHSAGKPETPRNEHGHLPAVTWIIEISSQVIFSASATVGFELIIGRDETSVELGFGGLGGTVHTAPGQLLDHQQMRKRKDGHSTVQHKGVYSKATRLFIDDTSSLWHKPSLPAWDDEGGDRGRLREHPGPPVNAENELQPGVAKAENGTKRRKIHLVVLTHGLHGNLGADMLYLKESIDAAAKQARLDARKRRANGQEQAPQLPSADTSSPDVSDPNGERKDHGSSTAPLSGGQDELRDRDNDESDDEEVIVRGFSGNTVRTERGIQYLGKRLAKWVLTMTYPDQPYVPTKKSVTKSISRALIGQEAPENEAGTPTHPHSSVLKEQVSTSGLAYQITSISFIGHSLGGLTQTYAIAYIHKHSPDFFKLIKPINFVTLASPFLGLSNENPLYVKFALDFGLVGRTGQDLGLTWRAPTVVRSGWGAMIAGIGTEGQRAQRQADPGSKPLLRVLPIGPAHQALKLFRNRTIYSNVVNDGIVPLRTSCLLFLDWSGLGRVEKARRENGLVGTVAGWGWAELTGANSTTPKLPRPWYWRSISQENSGDEGLNTPTVRGEGGIVPQPDENATEDDNEVGVADLSERSQFMNPNGVPPAEYQDAEPLSSPTSPNPFVGFLNLLRPSPSNKSPGHSPKHAKIYRRSQTLKPEPVDESPNIDNGKGTSPTQPAMVRGGSILDDLGDVVTPPKTSVFEAAGDILSPPLPTQEFILDPTSRPRTIFHDRVYHPNDIPSPPVRRRPSILSRTFSGDKTDNKPRPPSVDSEASSTQSSGSSGMRVEEKIARAYHRDLSWRKVLVRLEPDAHNNIFVRRMFSNAYGWPVVKHLVDTHFADTYAAAMPDMLEPNVERAKPMHEAVGTHGSEIIPTVSEPTETSDELHELKSPTESVLSSNSRPSGIARWDSSPSVWDDRFFSGSDDDDDDGEDNDAGGNWAERPRTPVILLLPPAKTARGAGAGTGEPEDKTLSGKAALTGLKPPLGVRVGLGMGLDVESVKDGGGDVRPVDGSVD